MQNIFSLAQQLHTGQMLLACFISQMGKGDQSDHGEKLPMSKSLHGISTPRSLQATLLWLVQSEDCAKEGSI